MQTETKGTVLIKTAQELTDFSRGEEQMLEEQIKAKSLGPHLAKNSLIFLLCYRQLLLLVLVWSSLVARLVTWLSITSTSTG